MLRIMYHHSETEQRWTLCGQLAGPWVGELRVCWEHSRSVAENLLRVVDLTDVTFIDESGETLLSEMRNAGTTFVAAGVETRYLVDNLKAKGARPLRRSIGVMAKRCGEKKVALENGRNE